MPRTVSDRQVDREARTKSEDISDEVMTEVVRALQKRVESVDHGYDVPYIAGYSRDARTIYIDRHLPRSYTRWTTRIYVTPFLVTHEIVEKSLLDELRLHYLHAHQIALRAERAAVESAGHSWAAYQRFVMKYEKPIEEESLRRVPPDLDLTPYRDEHDFELLQQLVEAEAARRRSSKLGKTKGAQRTRRDV